MTIATNRVSPQRILAASMVGTAIEFFDFYIYGTAASLVFAALFFPKFSASAGLLASFATFGVAFVARPIGAIVFGHFGDRIGRKSTLVASLLLMGSSTVLIAFLPTYAQIGWIAPLLLCLLRFGQGFGLGGEWGGAALLANENAPQGWQARYGTAPQQGAPIGFFLANGLFMILTWLLTPAQFLEWGWRIPFLTSVFMVMIGLWIRLKLTETPAFIAALERAPPPSVPLFTVVRDHWREIATGAVGGIACFVIFYIMTTFALSHGTTALRYSRAEFLAILVTTIPLMAVGVHLSGWLADVHADQRRVLILGTLMTIAAGVLLPYCLIADAAPRVWLFMAFSALSLGVAYGPLGSWLPSLFPVAVRYTGVSVAFNTTAIIGGGLTPIIAKQLSDRGGLTWVGLFLAGAGVVSLIGLSFPKAKRPGITPGPCSQCQ